MHIAAGEQIRHALLPAIDQLRATLDSKAKHARLKRQRRTLDD